ncbi:hypothetical protein JW499_22055, partial [Amphritea sp. ZJ14W]|nr:hypothetical protein [Amphritea pacifica]
LVSSPSHQGILSYQLHLVHRYHRYFDSIPLHGFSTSQQPEELEPARPRDPTTAAYDAKTNRQPDYWFSMDDDEFEEAIAQLRAEQRFMPSMGPEI